MKLNKTLHIFAKKWIGFNDDWEICIADYQRESNEDVLIVDIAQHDYEIDLPEFDESKLALAEIEQLEKMRVEVLAKNKIRLNSIDEKIQSLRALENQAA